MSSHLQNVIGTAPRERAVQTSPRSPAESCKNSFSFVFSQESHTAFKQLNCFLSLCLFSFSCVFTVTHFVTRAPAAPRVPCLGSARAVVGVLGCDSVQPTRQGEMRAQKRPQAGCLSQPMSLSFKPSPNTAFFPLLPCAVFRVSLSSLNCSGCATSRMLSVQKWSLFSQPPLLQIPQGTLVSDKQQHPLRQTHPCRWKQAHCSSAGCSCLLLMASSYLSKASCLGKYLSSILQIKLPTTSTLFTAMYQRLGFFVVLARARRCRKHLEMDKCWADSSPTQITHGSTASPVTLHSWPNLFCLHSMKIEQLSPLPWPLSQVLSIYQETNYYT